METLTAIAETIRSASAPPPMTTKLVAIDGPGGAGKSSLAARLADELGGAQIVPTDEFASWEDPIDWWPRLIEQILEPLSHNKPGRYQRYDWQDRRLAEWIDVGPCDYVILEGVSASREAFRPFLAFTIWVTTPRDERLRRGLERDGEGARGQWERWMAAEDAYIEREHPEERADRVVSGMPSAFPEERGR
jgi:uridine kinase